MERFFSILEIFISFTENLLIFSIICNIAIKKHSPVRQSAFVVLLSLLLTGVVYFLNSFEAFSFFTIFVGIFSFIILSRFVSIGKPLLRATACAIAFFFMHSIEYVSGFSLALLLGSSSSIDDSFMELMRPGLMRTIFLLVNRSIQAILVFSLSTMYSKINILKNKHLATVLGITAAAYLAMSILLNMIITDSLVVLQIAVILSWLFIMLCVVVAICTVTISTRYQVKKREAEMINLTNDLMTKNYQKLHDIQMKVSQQVHDFTNHLKTLNRLINNDIEAKEYIDTLLHSPKQQINQSQCGNHVIDAIINSKIEESAHINATFIYRVRLPYPDVKISPVDICAVLSNQLDNAIEACALLPVGEDRFISLDIWKKESFVFFKVINRTNKEPEKDRFQLVSTKNESDGIHGLGIKNIRETAEKYGGSLEMTCENGHFTSIAMLQETE